MPTIESASPSAQAISVADGRKETIRCIANASLLASLLSFLRRAEQSIDFGAHRVKFFLQHGVTLDCVAADLLIHVRGHAREVSDVRLQTWFAVTHRFR